MRFNFLVLCLILISVLILQGTVAQAAGACDINSCSGQIRKMIIDSGGVFIQLNADLAPLNCAPDSRIYLRLLKTHPNFDTIYTSLLAHKMTGDSVTFRIDEKSNPCNLNYIVLGD